MWIASPWFLVYRLVYVHHPHHLLLVYEISLSWLQERVDSRTSTWHSLLSHPHAEDGKCDRGTARDVTEHLIARRLECSSKYSGNFVGHLFFLAGWYFVEITSPLFSVSAEEANAR